MSNTEHPTRTQARAAALPDYHGRACEACGSTLRRTSNGACRNCVTLEREASLRRNQVLSMRWRPLNGVMNKGKTNE